MASAIAIPPPPDVLVPQRRRPVTSSVHRTALALVWLTTFLGAFVRFEPAPFDAMTFGLFVLLPTIGLIAWRRPLFIGLATWLAIAALSYVAAAISRDAGEAAIHVTVTLYLSVACFLFASFVAKRPKAHARLLINAYLTSAVISATLGVVGYLDLPPGAFDWLTVHQRAAAGFKDPNVFGPYLICGLLASLHVWLTLPPARGFGALASATIIALGILFSFSRGAWAATIFGLAVYLYLYALTATRNIQRLKVAAAALIGASAVGLLLAAALQSEAVARLLAERAALTLPYDQGAEGRFGGQLKAIDLVLSNPLGIGAAIFAGGHHHEEVHNVYLSMLLTAGWIGGLLFFVMQAATLALGFRHALRPTATQGLFLVVYAALAANIVEGALIDTDHWRHLFLLTGVAWGLMAADRRIPRRSRVMRDVRPALLNRALIVAPSRRAQRIVRRASAATPTSLPYYGLAQPKRRRRRGPRLTPAT